MTRIHVLAALTLSSVVCFVVVVVLRRKSRKARGDDRRRYDRLAVLWGAGFFLAVCGVQFIEWLHDMSDAASVLLVAVCAGGLLSTVAGLRWLRSKKYFRELYYKDRGFCGRCGYDLTGNVSGVCPECGWKLPERQDRREE